MNDTELVKRFGIHVTDTADGILFGANFCYDGWLKEAYINIYLIKWVISIGYMDFVKEPKNDN